MKSLFRFLMEPEQFRNLLIVFGLLLLLALIPAPASAWTDTFQSASSLTNWVGTGAATPSFYRVANSQGEGTDSYKLRFETATSPGGWQDFYVRSTVSTPTNYWAVTVNQAWVDNSRTQELRFRLYDAGAGQIFQVNTGGLTTGRYEIKKENGRIYWRINAGSWTDAGALSTTPYYFAWGMMYNSWSWEAGHCIIDDVIIGGTTESVLDVPPQNFYLAKDMNDPTLKGLFDNLGNNLYNSLIHVTYASSTPNQVITVQGCTPVIATGYSGTATINITPILLTNNYGTIPITYGGLTDYIIYKSVALTGTDINWTNPSVTTPFPKTYIDGDNAILTYDTGSAYWLPSSYSYKVDILRIESDGSFTSVASYPIATQTGSITVNTGSFTQAYYYAALIANPILAPTTDYYLDTDLMYLNTGLVKVYGTVYNANTGATIGSQVVGISQSGTWKNATSDGSGYFEKNSFNAGLPITFTVIKAGYQTHTFTFTPLSGGSYQCDMYLTPLPPAITDGSTTVFGYVLITPYGNAADSATVCLWNSTHLDTKTTTSGGYYEFTNLYNNTVYNINATAPGFTGNNVSTVTTGATNSTTYKELWITGNFVLTVQVRDSSSNALISESTEVSLSDGQTATTTTGSTIFYVGYAVYSITSSCSGYTSGSASVTVTGNTTATVYLDPIAVPTYPTPIPFPSQINVSGGSSGGSGIGYPPHDVRFLIQDTYGRPIQYATVTATPMESTTPWSWLTSWIGINSTVNIQGQTLSGTTGRDGSWDTKMVESVRYTIQVTNATQGINHAIDLYPKEESYTIWINLKGTKNLTQYPSWVLDAQTYNATYISLNMSYQDIAGKTTTLTYWVKSVDNTLIYSKVYTNPAAGYTNWSYQVLNTNGNMYYFGFNASNSDYGNVTGAKGITMHGSGPLVDFGITDTSWYMWFALLFMFLIGGIFSAKNIFLGAVVTPLWGGLLFTYIGWIPWYMGAGIVGAGISIAVGLGVLAYMRQQEYKLRV